MHYRPVFWPNVARFDWTTPKILVRRVCTAFSVGPVEDVRNGVGPVKLNETKDPPNLSQNKYAANLLLT